MFFNNLHRWTSRNVAILTLAVLALGPAAGARAGIMTPAGLNPGQEFRIVFVTNTSTTGLSSNISFYDAIVSSDAVAGGLATYNGQAVTWETIGSTPTVNAIDRLPADTVPIFLPDGTLVAATGTALWNTTATTNFLSSPIDEFASGTGTPFGAQVWTGTAEDGKAPTGSVVRGLGDPIGGSILGGASFRNSGWVHLLPVGLTDLKPLYGFSNVLTVAEPASTVIPEPSSIILWGIGGLFLTIGCLRRRVM